MTKIKKYLIVLIGILCLIPSLTFAKTNKVTVYIFRGEGCGYCARAVAYFKELVKNDDYKDKFEVKTYEVWKNTNNSKLMAAVADKLGKTVSGVPFIVIGETTFGGYSSSYNSDIEEAIDNYYDGKNNYTDVVAQTIKDSDYDDKVEMTTLDEISETSTSESSSSSSTETSNTESSKSSSSNGTVIGIVCILIGGLAALIYVSRS